MRFHYTQIFLLIWITGFWMYHFLTYGKVEEAHEKSMQKTYGTIPVWSRFFGLTFFLWTAFILIYFFHYESSGWLVEFSFLDHIAVRIAGMVLMCGAFALYVIFTATVGKSIREGVVSNEKPELVTTGLYNYVRNPAYLAFFFVAIGILLIIPNLISLLLLGYTIVTTTGHTAEEEKKLVSIYGEDYENYKRRTGRFLPKLKQTGR